MASVLVSPKSRILVTGGAGFVGSHLVGSLLNSGASVTVLDDFSTGTRHNLLPFLQSPNLKVIEGSILNSNLVSAAVKDSTHVFHLGAAVGVSNIMKNPIESFKVNTDGTENVLSACTSAGVRMLLTSSSEIYGKNTKSALGENDDRVLGSPEKYRWLYSEAKAIDESFAMLHSLAGLDVRIVRLFNTVGPRQSAKYGMVLPNFVESAIAGRPLIVHGDGSQSRCFAHVEDVVEAIQVVMFDDRAKNQIFNVGNPEEITIVELAQMVVEISESKSAILFKSHDDVFPNGFEDMKRRVPDISKINNLLGWKPRKKIRKIVEETVDYFQTLS